MPRRSASRDRNLFEKHPAGLERHAAEQRFFGRARLLEDLLQHEVAVAGFLGHDRIPQHALRHFRDRRAGEVRKLHALARDDRHLFVAEKHDVARVAEDGRRVGGHEELAVAEPDDDGRAVADRDDLLRIVGRNRDEREEAAHLQQRPLRRALEVASVSSHLVFEQVGDDLRVGLGDERVAELLQLALEIKVILDDAVVHDDDLAGAVLMGMRVLFGRPAVRGPTRVPDAVDALERLRVDGLLEVDELARASTPFDEAVSHDSDARRSRSPRYSRRRKPVEQHRHDFLRAEISDDSAHT